MITPDIRKMTQTEFDNFMADLKVNDPNFFQFPTVIYQELQSEGIA